MLEDSIVNGNKNKNTDIEQKKSKEDAAKIIHKLTQLTIKLKSEVVNAI